MNFATIDIGSNTLLLLIAELNAEGKIIPLVEKAEITRLSQGLNEKGVLNEEAMERSLVVLRQFTDICHRNHVSAIACVGTEALRLARNSQEFIARVKKQCGFIVEIIPGKKEAELAYFSALLDFEDLYSNLVVLDIGAGSTEIIWPLENNGHTAKLQTLSMRMGAVRFTEEFIHSDPPSRADFQILSEKVEEKLTKDFDPLPKPWTQTQAPLTLIGLAGTVTTLSALDQQLAVYDHAKIQGAKLKLARLERLVHVLRAKPLEERKLLPGMEPKRADVLLAGAVILEKVMQKLGVEEVVVSDHGIRYGLFHQKFSERP